MRNMERLESKIKNWNDFSLLMLMIVTVLVAIIGLQLFTYQPSEQVQAMLGVASVFFSIFVFSICRYFKWCRVKEKLYADAKINEEYHLFKQFYDC